MSVHHRAKTGRASGVDHGVGSIAGERCEIRQGCQVLGRAVLGDSGSEGSSLQVVRAKAARPHEPGVEERL